MITAKRVLKLSEEWFKQLKRDYNNAPFDVYVNPGSSDFIDIYKKDKRTRIRFLADNKTKKVYVWDAFLAIHPYVAKELGISFNLYSCHDPNIITGEANISGSHASVLTVYPTNPNLIKDVAKINWLWLNGYLIGIQDAIQDYMDRM